MDTQIVVALIGTASTIVGTLIQRVKPGPDPTPDSPAPELTRDKTARTLAIVAVGVGLTAAALAVVSSIQTKDRRGPAIHFLDATEYKKLWESESGGPRVADVSSFVPESASGVLLNVLAEPIGGQTAGSFVCADKNGQFSPNLPHYNQITVSNYERPWKGGLVICPLKANRTLVWQMMVDGNLGASKDMHSTGTLLGWF